jgi:hypothetical protein
MKKQWLWVAFCLITALGIVLGWNWQSLQLRPQVLETSFERSPIEAIAPHRYATQPEPTAPNDFVPRSPIAPPTVDADRLWKDVTALAFKRYDEIDRDLARRYILQSLSDAGWSPQAQAFDQGVNIVAERPGTNPAAGKIVLGAHYDTVKDAPGADDNATAVATVLEAARLLQSVATARTLQVVLFDEEEVGLLGSLAFVDRPDQQNGLQGAVILEMLGYACYVSGCQSYPAGLPIALPIDRGDFLAVVGDQEHLPLIRSFEQASRSNLPPVLTLPVPLVRFLPPDLLRSDHAPFWQKGFGAVMVTDTANFRNPNYHQPSDRRDTIDRSFFNGSAQLVVNAITTLLSSEGNLTTEAVNLPGNDDISTTPL